MVKSKATGFLNTDIIKGLDRFYDQPENLKLPVRIALRILAMKVAGKPPAEIES